MTNSRIIHCCVCAKQVVPYDVSPDDKYCTTGKNAKCGFKPNECFCDICGKDLDENGLFPEERDGD